MVAVGAVCGHGAYLGARLHRHGLGLVVDVGVRGHFAALALQALEDDDLLARELSRVEGEFDLDRSEGAMGVNAASDVTSAPFAMRACPVALSMSVPLTV